MRVVFDGFPVLLEARCPNAPSAHATNPARQVCHREGLRRTPQDQRGIAAFHRSFWRSIPFPAINGQTLGPSLMLSATTRLAFARVSRMASIVKAETSSGNQTGANHGWGIRNRTSLSVSD